MKVSVVVPVYNRKKDLIRCLDSLKNQDYKNYEIIVVDDGSSEDLSDVCKDVIYFKQKNKGPAAARNKGVSLAKGEFILFTDSDCFADSSWVSKMVACKGDIIGGKTIEMGKDSVFGILEHTDSNFEYYFPSNNLGVKKKIFEELGGFNESFDRPGGEDVDFCIRAGKKGYKLNYCSGIIKHYHTFGFVKGLRREFNYGVGDAQFIIANKENRKFKPLHLLYFPLSAFKSSLKQMKIKKRWHLFILIYFLYLLLIIFNLSGKIYWMFRKFRFSLIFYKSQYVS